MTGRPGARDDAPFRWRRDKLLDTSTRNLSHRDGARLRLVALAAEYDAFGPPPPSPVTLAFDDLRSATARLTQAIDRGDLDDADAAAAWLGRHASPAELGTLLADAVIPRLGAAADL